MTGFFASGLRPLASEPSIDAGSCVQRIIDTTHTTKMREIKVAFDAADIQHLDQQAAAAGTSRAALIRDRALSAGLPRLTTAAYHALVADVVAFNRGDIHRQRVETIVAYVIARLDQHQPSSITSHQSPP